MTTDDIVSRGLSDKKAEALDLNDPEMKELWAKYLAFRRTPRVLVTREELNKARAANSECAPTASKSSGNHWSPHNPMPEESWQRLVAISRFLPLIRSASELKRRSRV